MPPQLDVLSDHEGNMRPCVPMPVYHIFKLYTLLERYRQAGLLSPEHREQFCDVFRQLDFGGLPRSAAEQLEIWRTAVIDWLAAPELAADGPSDNRLSTAVVSSLVNFQLDSVIARTDGQDDIVPALEELLDLGKSAFLMSVFPARLRTDSPELQRLRPPVRAFIDYLVVFVQLTQPERKAQLAAQFALLGYPVEPLEEPDDAEALVSFHWKLLTLSHCINFEPRQVNAARQRATEQLLRLREQFQVSDREVEQAGGSELCRQLVALGGASSREPVAAEGASPAAPVSDQSRATLADMLIDRFLAAAERNDEEEQQRAIGAAFSRMDGAAMVAAWLRALDKPASSSATVARHRAFAAFMLTLHKIDPTAPKAAIGALIAILAAMQGVDDTTRAVAAKALVTIDPQNDRVVAAVHAALCDRRFPDALRESFALALGLVDSQRAAQLLLSVLRDAAEVPKVRYMAAVGMTKHVPARKLLVPELMKLSRDPQLGMAAKSLLQKLGSASG